MPWLQLKAHIAPEQAETLEELLLAEGATAITLQDAHDDPVFEPDRGSTPLWHETVLTGLYDDLEGVDAMLDRVRQDRKSTRLNSSHVRISYAVFCLKKKNQK